MDKSKSNKTAETKHEQKGFTKTTKSQNILEGSIQDEMFTQVQMTTAQLITGELQNKY